jgi:fatty acid desaturase
MVADHVVKAVVRAEVPADTFARRPQRSIFLVPLGIAILLVSAACIVLPIPWFILVVLSIVLGNLYGSLMFLSHEIGHGAVVRSRRLQRLLMYPGCAIFLLSPHLWTLWHNQSHHGHTNQAEEDPDSFGSLENFLVSPRIIKAHLKFAPGAQYWRAVLWLFTFFTLQGQTVLWSKSKTFPGFERLNRRRAATESAVMLAFWVALSLSIGARPTVFVVIVPMLVANFVVLSYVVTNHMVRPLAATTETLQTTMSVSTNRLLDRFHFHFSHHVEHHLFPAMSSCMAPRVRNVLERHFAPQYLAPAHWRALLAVLQTPRIYDGPVMLVDPYEGRQAATDQVADRLRRPVRSAAR